MSNKESFYRQIEIAKQQIANEKLQVERKAAEDQHQIEQDKIKKEIESQRVFEIRKQETIKNFAGTNIIETLEEIRDKEILTVRSEEIHGPKINFWGNKTGNYDVKTRNTPCDIQYYINSIKTGFDYWYYSDDGRSFSGERSITITKNNNLFNLKFEDDHSKTKYDFEFTSVNPIDIINGIAKVVALKQVGQI